MFNADELINDYNNQVFNKKLEETIKELDEREIDYYQVLDDDDEDNIITCSTNVDISRCCIKESDQERVIRINKNELLTKLGLEDKVDTNIDEEIELNVLVVGRDLGNI